MKWSATPLALLVAFFLVPLGALPVFALSRSFALANSKVVIISNPDSTMTLYGGQTITLDLREGEVVISGLAHRAPEDGIDPAPVDLLGNLVRVPLVQAELENAVAAGVDSVAALRAAVWTFNDSLNALQTRATHRFSESLRRGYGREAAAENAASSVLGSSLVESCKVREPVPGSETRELQVKLRGLVVPSSLKLEMPKTEVTAGRSRNHRLTEPQFLSLAESIEALVGPYSSPMPTVIEFKNGSILVRQFGRTSVVGMDEYLD